MRAERSAYPGGHHCKTRIRRKAREEVGVIRVYGSDYEMVLSVRALCAAVSVRREERRFGRMTQKVAGSYCIAGAPVVCVCLILFAIVQLRYGCRRCGGD